MRFNRQEISGFNGGGFSSQWKIGLDAGPVYKKIELVTNLDNDQFTKILLTLNGKPIVNCSGTDLRMLQAFKGEYVEDGVFVIPFYDHTMKSQEGQDVTELVTLPGDNLVLTIFTGAATGAQTGASLVPTIEAYGTYGQAKAQRLVVPKIYNDLVQIGKTGENVFRNFERGPRIRRMHMESANITTLEIKRDKLTQFKLPQTANDRDLKRNGLTPQVGYFHFDAVQEKFGLSDPLKTAGSSFEIIPTVTATGDITVLFETVEAA